MNRPRDPTAAPAIAAGPRLAGHGHTLVTRHRWPMLAVAAGVAMSSGSRGGCWRSLCCDGESAERERRGLSASGLRVLLMAALVGGLSGCAVVTVAGAAVAVGAAVVGTAVDVTVGAAKVAGKAVGRAVDAVRAEETKPLQTDEEAAAKK